MLDIKAVIFSVQQILDRGASEFWCMENLFLLQILYFDVLNTAVRNLNDELSRPSELVKRK